MRKFLFFLFLTTFTSLAWAQMPTDLSRIKVSELSDDQIRDIVRQGEARGMNISDGERLALSMGLPAEEAVEFKKRLATLNSGPIPAFSKPTTQPDSTRTVLRPSSVVERIENKNDSLKADSVRKEVYGRSIYRNSKIQLTGQATESKAPDNYVLGPGDELVVSVFGTSYANEVLRIDEKGVARVRGMGNMYLTGLSYEAARKLIRAKFGQFYDLNNNQLEISLLHSRVIKINVVGDVVSPGTYEFSALNSVFNALVAAGGPTGSGSVRQIEVQRGGKVMYRFDTYQFLAGKLSSQPFSLSDQDYIVVKPLGNVVEVMGAVRRPGLYEVIEGEDLNKLFEWAGGISGKAYLKSVQRVTFTNGAREVLDYDLQEPGNMAVTLGDGDEILVRSMPDDVRNALEVIGEVNQPGSYTFEAGITISSLIKRAGGLQPTAYGQKAFLSRRKSDLKREMMPLNLELILADTLSKTNMTLQPYDKLIVVSKISLLDSFDIQVVGAVRKPGPIEFANGLKLGDVLLQAGGLKVEADVKRIEIIRLALFDEKAETGARSLMVGVEVKNGELSGADLAMELMPYDRVYVRTLADYVSPATVVLEGEFRYPGTYALLSRDERLVDLIERAGGFKPQAFVSAAKFYRETAPGGQVLIDLEKVLNREKSRYNYTLLDGDRLVVPEYVPYVSLQGPGVQYIQTTGLEAVNAPYKPGLRAHRYVQRYGDGFSDRAHKKRVFVVAANDKVSRTRDYGLFKVYPKVSPGATVYVVERELSKREKQKGEPINWNRVIENTTVKLTGLATLYILISQITANR